MTITYIGATAITFEGTINKANTEVDLIVPQDLCAFEELTIFGIVQFSTKYHKSIQFVHIKDRLWRANLSFTKEDKPYLADVRLCLLLKTYDNEIETNDIKLIIDIPSVNLSIRDINNTEILDMKKEIASLKNKLNALSKNYSLGALAIENNKYIKPGMVPMAIEGGKWVAQYPFVNMLKAVNDKRSADGEIQITPQDIPMPDGSTLDQSIKSMHDVLTAQNNLCNEIVEQLKTLSNTVAEMQIQIAQLTNKGLL